MRRLTRFALPGLLVLTLIFVAGCGGGSDSGGGTAPAMNYSGTYQYTVYPNGEEGETKSGTAVMTQEGSNVTMVAPADEGGNIVLQGTVSGNIVTMTQTNNPIGHTMTIVIGFSDDGQSFSGTVAEEDEGKSWSVTITGTKIS